MQIISSVFPFRCPEVLGFSCSKANIADCSKKVSYYLILNISTQVTPQRWFQHPLSVVSVMITTFYLIFWVSPVSWRGDMKDFSLAVRSWFYEHTRTHLHKHEAKFFIVNWRLVIPLQWLVILLSLSLWHRKLLNGSVININSYSYKSHSWKTLKYRTSDNCFSTNSVSWQ